ncbi:hypothetical protein LXL04_025023 [Taraxacum kok-saghyz]
MASIKERSVSIFFIFICAIFIMQVAFIFTAADQGRVFRRIARSNPIKPPSPKGNPPRSMIPPLLDTPPPPPPIYT